MSNAFYDNFNTINTGLLRRRMEVRREEYLRQILQRHTEPQHQVDIPPTSSSMFYENEEQLRVDNLIKERDKTHEKV